MRTLLAASVALLSLVALEASP
ncbi:jg244, partial [Pararge aegeria aegeria]